MKRTKALRLVLLGGGVATMLAACGGDEARQHACQEAKAAQRPDAAQICARSTSGSSSSSRGYYGGAWTAGRTSSPSSAAVGTSSRGGFGSSSSAGS